MTRDKKEEGLARQERRWSESDTANRVEAFLAGWLLPCWHLPVAGSSIRGGHVRRIRRPSGTIFFQKKFLGLESRALFR